MEAREKERTGIATLRIDYNRVSGYFIEVPKGQSENVPADFRRRQTLKNTERYITPELKQYEDQRISAKERASQIERALWDELVTYMHGWVEVLLAAAHAAAALDVLLGFARHAFEMRWTRPQLMSAPGIDITGARHPVVEKMIDGYIPNNCSLVPGRRLLIITGPNMGGKIHLHALCGTHCASCVRGKLCARSRQPDRTGRQDPHPESAPQTTSPAAGPPLWWR